MMENKNDFEFKYSAPSSAERKEIESIRKSYLPKTEEENKLKVLRKLDGKVKNMPQLVSLIVGICGILIFGLGMTMFLEWGIIAWGVIVCVVAIPPMCIAYPIYLKMSKKMTEKYREEILKLSEELLNEEEKES
ncbi:MAG: hypothetical protein J6K97_03295 [Clostridia bacterium]|nr:hypothetical protein [Clostridia bacterium]